MTLGDSLERDRKFLRDPDGNLWGRGLLVNLYNDTQKEIQVRTSYLEDVEVVNVPPFYQWSYLYDWEWRYMDGSKFHQCLRYHEQGDFSFTYLWEPECSGVSDRGPRHTHPWEAWSSLGTGDVVSIPFPENFHSVQMLAYKREPLEAVTRKYVTSRDNDFATHTGEPQFYWRDDDLGNSFVPYPRPSSVEWNDVIEQQDPDIIYTFDWEADEVDEFSEGWTRTDEDNEREYLYLWEKDPGLTDPGMRGMHVFETEFSNGMVLYVEDDTTDALGTFQARSGSLFNQEDGIAVKVLDDTNNFLLVYDVTPEDVKHDTDESDFPRFMRKYIEHRVIARAYGANTDGRIQSLSDYWDYRFEVGMKMIERFMAKKKEDRDYRFVTSSREPLRSRHPRLPSSYPAV